MMHNNGAVVILAAGHGKRIGGKSKLLRKLGGLEIIGHVLRSAIEIGLEKVIVVVNQDTENEIRCLISNLNIFVDKNIEIVIQDPDNYGTGIAILSAMDHLQKVDRVLVMLGDVPMISSKSLQNMYNITHSDIVVGVYPTNCDNDGGVVDIDDKGYVRRIVEKCDRNEDRGDQYINSGIMCFNVDVLNRFAHKIVKNKQNEVFLTDIMSLAYNNASSEIYRLSLEEGLGINTLRDLCSMEKRYQNKLRDKMLDRGVELRDYDSIFLSYDTEIGSGSIIEPHVTMGNGVKIGHGSIIRGFSYIENSIISDCVTIGPYARLRGDNIINNDAVVGSFVEIKNSYIGNGSKVKHLSYVGDGILGNNVNLGAGVVFCNYDGKRKYKTEIGSGCFIGSHTIILSPITIGKGAFIAAGTIVEKDIQDGSFVIGRTRCVEKKDKAKHYV